MKKKDVSEEELSGEEHEEVEGDNESEEEWTPSEEPAAKKRPQRNASNKKRQHSEEEEEDDEEEEEEEEEDEDEEEEESDSDSGKKSKRRRRSKKNEEDEEDSDENTFGDSSGVPPKDFTSGAFVVSKNDMSSNETDPILWRIDGKALLQKYLPFQENGKTLYRSTSTYSGWSVNNKDNYLAAKVSFKVESRSETVVELHLDELKNALKEEVTTKE